MFFFCKHSNVWGPSPTLSIGGVWCLINLIDDYIKIYWFYLHKNKSKVNIDNFDHLLKPNLRKIFRIYNLLIIKIFQSNIFFLLSEESSSI